ncbi:tripartite motif-containing protein 56 [Mytilus galloprovincialis]|uniref:Tripartite motif-containing protein 56 n=1 Tax=Mytilus galloprovincialis TaxID=29158 RepID=A0A8B6F3V0_MYTGA|nr:tripartite motif-containing protein 56 [Mytilus galloprovincialis]
MSGAVANPDSPPGDIVCDVCNNVFQKPRMLPCLHSMCFDCLQRILDTNKTADTIECSTCEETIEISAHDAREFPSNEYLITVIDVYFSRHGGDKQCAICDLRSKKIQAKFKCVDCEDFLCEACGGAHSSTRMTIEHSVLSLDELARGSHDDIIREKRMMHCQHHEKEVLDHYCKSCNKAFSDVDESKRGKISEIISRLDIKIKDLFDADVESETVVRELDKSEQTAIDEVEHTTKQLQERIEKEKTELIDTVKKHVTTEKERINGQKDGINQRHAFLTYGSEFCSRVTENGKEAEVIYMEPELSGRLRYLDRLPQPNTTIRCQFPEVKLRNLYGNVNNIKFFEFTPGTTSTVASILPPSVEESDIPKVLSLNLKRRINVFLSDDETSPKITGLCVIKNEIYVSDYANRKIKIFSLKGEHIDTLQNIAAFSITGFDDVIAV